MFSIALHDTTNLLDALTPFTKLSNRLFILKCSSSIFNLTFCQKSPHLFRVQLYILPPFFSQFLCQKPPYSLISLSYLYNTMLHMKRSNFSSFRLHFRPIFPLFPSSANLYFNSPFFVDYVLKHELKMLVMGQKKNVKKRFVCYSYFVTIDSKEFRSILQNNISLVHVTLTHSQVKFSGPITEIILTTEERQCIVGGVAEGDEIQFQIPLSFHSFYFELTNCSKRIWLFKSTNSWTVLNAPIGLYAGYSIYFPRSENI